MLPSQLPVVSVPATKPMALSNDSINALAGATAGLVAGVAVCPLDVAKTKLQIQGSFKLAEDRSRYRGIAGTIRTIVTEDGFRGLYRGLTPMVVGYLPTWAIYFFVYGKIQKPGKDYTAAHTMLSAVVAGASSTLCTNPIWVIKTRLMAQGHHTSWQYDGIFDAARQIFKKEGPLAFYSGLGSALLGLPHVAIQFPTYEFLKRKLHSPSAPNWYQVVTYLTSSVLSKIIASSITYPHEVVRSRQQISGALGDQRYSSILKTVVALYRNEGWRGFYAGLGTNICRAVPASAVTLMTYETVSHFLRQRYL